MNPSPHYLTVSLDLHGGPDAVHSHVSSFHVPDTDHWIITLRTDAGDIHLHGSHDELLALAAAIVTHTDRSPAEHHDCSR